MEPARAGRRLICRGTMANVTCQAGRKGVFLMLGARAAVNGDRRPAVRRQGDFYWLLSPGASSRRIFIMRRKNLSVKESVRSNSSSLGIPEPFGCAVGAPDNLLLNSAFSRLSRESGFFVSAGATKRLPVFDRAERYRSSLRIEAQETALGGSHCIAPRFARGRRLVFRPRRGGERQGAAK